MTQNDSAAVPSSPGATLSYRPWQVRILAATWLSYAGYYFCRKTFYVVKADMAAGLDLTTQHLAHLGTGYLAAYSVGQFSSAFFGRKLGPKLLLLAGMAVSITSNIAFGFSKGFWVVLVFMTFNGLAQGTGWPGCIGSLAHWFKRAQRGSILGLWSTCYQLGPVMATSFAAYLLGLAGWRTSFFGGALVLCLVWCAVLLLHPNRPEAVGLEPIVDEDGAAAGSEPKEEGGRGDEGGLGWGRDTVVTVLTMGSIYFCIKFLRYALWSWSAFFLRENFGLAGDSAGYLSTAFEACGFAGVIAAGFASDRIFKGRRAFLAFAMLALMTLSFLLMATLGVTSVVFFTVSLGLAGFMLFGPDSLVSGVGAIDVGSRRGALAAAGIINGMGSIGPIFQEELIGWMYRIGNQRLMPILLMLVFVALAGTCMTFILWLRTRAGKAAL